MTKDEIPTFSFELAFDGKALTVAATIHSGQEIDHLIRVLETQKALFKAMQDEPKLGPCYVGQGAFFKEGAINFRGADISGSGGWAFQLMEGGDVNAAPPINMDDFR